MARERSSARARLAFLSREVIARMASRGTLKPAGDSLRLRGVTFRSDGRGTGGKRARDDSVVVSPGRSARGLADRSALESLASRVRCAAAVSRRTDAFTLAAVVKLTFAVTSLQRRWRRGVLRRLRADGACCPITLEPLRYPIVSLHTRTYSVEPLVLYMLDSGKFQDPSTRSPLTDDELQLLDELMAAWGVRAPGRVFRARYSHRFRRALEARRLTAESLDLAEEELRDFARARMEEFESDDGESCMFAGVTGELIPEWRYQVLLACSHDVAPYRRVLALVEELADLVRGARVSTRACCPIGRVMADGMRLKAWNAAAPGAADALLEGTVRAVRALPEAEARGLVREWEEAVRADEVISIRMLPAGPAR